MKTTVSTMKAPVPKSRRLTAAQPRVSTETPTALRSQRARLDSFASTLFFISRAAAGLKSLGLVILASHNARRRRQRAGNWLKLSDAAQKDLLQESESHIRRRSPSLNTHRAGYTIQAGGPVAQGQSDRLITGWLEVRILPGPPFLCHGASRANRGVSQEPPPAGDRRLGCQRSAPARRRLAGGACPNAWGAV